MANSDGLYDEMTHWEKNGPYTFEAALELAQECASSKGEYQLGDFLDEVVEKFSPAELRKILNPQKHCSTADFKLWLKGTEYWELKRLPDMTQMTGEHLAALAEEICNFNEVAQTYFEEYSYDSKEKRSRLVKFVQKQQQRDASPTRK